jgi:carbamate kinase
VRVVGALGGNALLRRGEALDQRTQRRHAAAAAAALAQGETLREATPEDLAALALPAGSMGPKAEAAGQFAVRTGRRAAIGSLTDAAALVASGAGTRVRMSASPLGIR